LNNLIITDHARKHGVKDEDILYVISHPEEVILIEFEPDEKILYFGFDKALRELEVIVVVKRDGREIVIHAMKVTQRILDLVMEVRYGKEK
jgi:acetoin utilization deacetylase AcuC-like enzyme